MSGILAVTQRRSSNGCNRRQLDTLRSLGLRRIGHTIEIADSAQARGMVHAVRHIVEVSEPRASDSPKRASSGGTARAASEAAAGAGPQTPPKRSSEPKGAATDKQAADAQDKPAAKTSDKAAANKNAPGKSPDADGTPA
jgi:large subunit ribosomal protein L30